MWKHAREKMEDIFGLLELMPSLATKNVFQNHRDEAKMENRCVL
jgi:hypothetical protein